MAMRTTGMKFITNAATLPSKLRESRDLERCSYVQPISKMQLRRSLQGSSSEEEDEQGSDGFGAT